MPNDQQNPDQISSSVIDYPARDMTITVGTGMSAGQLCGILRHENQQLPIDTADGEITIRELVDFDISGPRQFGYGTLRDYVIGIEASDGSGRVFHAGGRVVKNEAGYDLCRLLIGNLPEGCRHALSPRQLERLPQAGDAFTISHLAQAGFACAQDD